MSACIFLFLLTCPRFHAESTLLIVQASVMAADGATTRSIDAQLRRNGVPPPYEHNPVARAVLGDYPTWPRMIGAGYAELTLESLAISELARSRHKVVRGLRWFVPTVGIAGHAFALGVTIGGAGQ
jgi:hypothetical protein